MNITAFHKLPWPVQSREEWQLLFEFLEGYFRNRGIEHPTVVELGIQSNLQKMFYETFLGAKHIGIDCSDRYSKPDILGDVEDPAVMDKALTLAGGTIDMVFQDAAQSYPEVKRCFDLWSPVAKSIYALHPILTTEAHPEGTRRLWAELNAAYKGGYQLMTFRSYLPPDNPCHRYQMGTGLILRDAPCKR